jgi:hypothetical protein
MTALNEYSYAKNSIGFFQRLLRGEDSFETLKAGLDVIKDVTKSAHEESVEIHKLFKQV